MTLNTGAAAVFEVLSTSTLRAAITDYTSGAQLLAAMSDTSVSVAATGNKALLALYANGNAYLYEIAEDAVDADAVVAAADIKLVGIFNGVASDAFVAGNFA